MSPSWPSARSHQAATYGSCTPLSTALQSDSTVLSAQVSAPGLIDPLSSAIGYSNASASLLSSDVATAFLAPPAFDTAATAGNLAIDALLSSSRAYWNTSANGGIITYSFLSNEIASSYYGRERVSEVNDAIKNNVRQILASLESFINVNFVEVADTATSFGILRYMFSSEPEYAYAYLPNADPLGGDVHLSPNYERTSSRGFAGGVGSYGYETLIHETLHALGLKHPGNYNGTALGARPFLPAAEDNNTNSLMTYNNAGSNAATPMAYDVRALQYLYGARTNNETDSTYYFNTVYNYTLNQQFFSTTSASLKQTIWDSGGIDTLNFSGLAASDYRFDLQEGGILTTQAAYSGATYRDRSGGGFFTTSAFGTTIAYNTVIENLINSPGNDLIIANNASNLFQGYAPGLTTGNDVYENTSNFDVIDLSGYTLADLNPTVSGSNFTIGLGTANGSIQINNYFGTSGSLRLLMDGNYYTYAVDSGWQSTIILSSETPSTALFPETSIAAAGGLTAIAPTNSNSAATLTTPERCQCAVCSATASARNSLSYAKSLSI